MIAVVDQKKKKDGVYITIKQPGLIKSYNSKMVGVLDFLDRDISMYRICGRTRKWDGKSGDAYV